MSNNHAKKRKAKQAATSLAATSKSTVSRSDLFSHTTVTNLLNTNERINTPLKSGCYQDDITVTTDSAANECEGGIVLGEQPML